MSTEPWEKKSHYSFLDMLKDTFGGGSGKSASSTQSQKDDDRPWGGFGESSKESSQDGFDPSEASGEAFRSVFGDDND